MTRIHWKPPPTQVNKFNVFDIYKVPIYMDYDFFQTRAPHLNLVAVLEFLMGLQLRVSLSQD